MFRDVPECSGMFHVPAFIDAHLHFAILRRPRLFDYLTVAGNAASYHGCHNYLSPASPEIAVTFLVESYKSVSE